ncbi:hypothetical protein LSH36_247g03033 [Paralvinella palmiformis]|uniref:Uncharacterized protein n=1 Tax=Paralvinella palmiformis TaxID=53620 RepID=A0AAD9JNB4_9ANNE|nr:hypothetical protein LSH36_247g03033 [Paralvinella palmiformis]
MKYVLTRELKGLNTSLQQLDEELADKKLTEKKTAKELAKTKKDFARLNKDHQILQKDDKLLSGDVEKVDGVLSSCRAEKDHSVFLRQGSELALDDQDKRIMKRRKEIIHSEEENKAAKKGINSQFWYRLELEPICL